MAVWQYDLRIIPRAALSAYDAAADGQLSAAQCEETNWWEGRRLPSGYVQGLEALLPKSRNWSSNWLIFGDEDGTRVDIILHGSDVKLVRLRLNARELRPDLFEQIVQFVKTSECAFITPECRVVDPEPLGIWVEFQLSKAAEFVHDPESFLAWLRRHPGRND